MRPIPKKVKDKLSADPRMSICIHNNSDCDRRIEWEHAFIYAGKQINEAWAIVGVCTYHHRGVGLDKDFNQWMALKGLSKGQLEDIKIKYPRENWDQKIKYLKSKYG